MLSARPEGYVGKQYAEGFTSYIIAGSYLGVVSIEDGLSQDEGKKLLESFKQGLIAADIHDLAGFETTVSSLILSLNFPVHVGFALGMQQDQILYLKTVGSGQIYYRRGKKLSLLVSGNSSASGYLTEFDMPIFTTSKIEDVIGEAADTLAFVELMSPQEIIEKIHTEEYGDEEQGFVALFAEYNSKGLVKQPSILDAMEPKINDPIADSVDQVIVPSFTPTTQVSFISRIRSAFQNKIVIIGVIVLLFGLLSWSVFFGYQRRQAAALNSRIEATSTEIQKILVDAEDGALVNLDASIALIADAKTALETLKSEAGTSHQDKIAAIGKQIADAEAAIMKRDEIPSTEFYDLALGAKAAVADALGVEKQSVALLDRSAKKAYVLDLENKSLKEYINSDIKDASIIALYNDAVYIFSVTKGVQKFTSQSKLNTLVEPDSEWGNIVDMELYNGNIYLLDEKNDEIYKYLVTEGGFSDKRSYLSSSQDLSSARSMSIDSAIYIAKKDSLKKYSSGAAEPFKPQLPTAETEFDAVFAPKDEEMVYVLDSTHASVYILTKEGEYVRQLQSSIFGKAQGILSFDSSVLVLVGSKIYSVSVK